MKLSLYKQSVHCQMFLLTLDIIKKFSVTINRILSIKRNLLFYGWHFCHTKSNILTTTPTPLIFFAALYDSIELHRKSRCGYREPCIFLYNFYAPSRNISWSLGLLSRYPHFFQYLIYTSASTEKGTHKIFHEKLFSYRF